MASKALLLSLSLVGALLISQTASADNRNHRRGYNDHGYSSHNYRNNYRRHYRANSYHYNSRDRRYRNSFNISYGNYYSHRRHSSSSSFVGGLVLGSLLSYPRYPTRSYETVVVREAPVIRTREVVYVDSKPATSPAPVASGRRLLRDLEGNCFERIVDQQGDEIRVQLEAEQCNF